MIDVVIPVDEVLAEFESGARRAVDDVFARTGEAVAVAVEEIRAEWPRKTGTSARGWQMETDVGVHRIANPVGYTGDVTIAGSGELAADQVVDPIIADTDARLEDTLPAVVEAHL